MDKRVYAQFNKGNPSWQEFLARAIRWAFTISNMKNDFLRNRAGWCDICKRGRRKLVAHHVEHIKKWHEYESWDGYIDAVFTANLQGLCNSCHSKLHGKKREDRSPPS